MPLLDLLLEPQTLKYILLTVLVILFSVYGMSNRPGGKNIPPCPGINLPLFGNLLELMRNPRAKVKRWRETHGDIVSVYLGKQHIVILYGYEIIKTALIKQANVFSDRPELPYDSLNLRGLGIATNSGPKWKEERRAVVHILKQLGLGRNWLGEKMREEIAYYIKEIDKSKGQPVNMRPLNQQSLFNIFLMVIMGKRFEYDDEEFTSIVFKVSQMMAKSSKAGMLQVFPILDKLPGDPFEGKAFYKILGDLVAHCTKTFVENEDVINARQDGEPSNIVAHYFEMMNKKKESGTETFMSKKNLNKSLIDLLGAGIDTTNTTVLWGILFLMHHPEAQTKAFEEIKQNVGTDRLPNLEDKTSLKYFNAVLMEMQRVACLAPFGLPHIASEDVNFQGYDIAKNTPIFINFDSILLDPNLWGKDAHLFRPGRFLDGTVREEDFEKCIPFGLGQRVCLGQSYAKMELFLFMSALIQRYEIKPENPSQLPSLEGSYGLENKPSPFKVRMVPRETTMEYNLTRSCF